MTRTQRLHFRVYDGHGDKVLKEGDKVGDGWIEVLVLFMFTLLI